MNKIIEKEDIVTLEYILSLKRISSGEVHIMQNFINKYIDNKCFICTTCPAQIRFAFNRIENWYNRNQQMILEVKNGKNPNKCLGCKVELTDKRRKFCQNCKEIK